MKLREVFNIIRNVLYYNLKRIKVPINRISCIEITNRCNQKCVFCPVNNKNVLRPIIRQKKDMRINDFERIIKKYKKYCYIINISQSHHGESFLHPRFNDVIAILKKYNVDYSITTNGSLVGKYIDTLIEYPPKLIMFSLYTLNPKKFKKLTKTGNLKTVLKNIEELLKIKEGGRIDTKIVIRAIVMRGFERDVENIKKYFKDRDVDFDINVLNSWAGRVDISKYGDVSKHTITFKYCFQPWSNIIIGSDLGVYICNNHEDKPIDYLKGNKTLEDIWNSQKYQKIRRNILNGQFRKNEICRYCDYFNFGSIINKPSPLFFLNKLFIYKILYLFGIYKIEDLRKTLKVLYE
ncbi:MAG: radical SAM protein [Candidatus Methanomethylicia archaeon]